MPGLAFKNKRVEFREIFKSKLIFKSLVIIIIAALFFLLNYYSRLEIKDTRLLLSGRTQSITLPYASGSSQQKDYDFLGDIKANFIHKNHLVLAADDCILAVFLNDKKIFQKKDADKCAHFDGININLKKFLKPGANTLKAVVHDDGGVIKFNIIDESTQYYFYLILLLLIILLFINIISGRALSWDRKLIWIIMIIAAFVRIVYFFNGSYDYRSYDVRDHLDYIRFILNNKRLPMPIDGWQMYQPPVYYTLSALIGNMAKIFVNINDVVLVRLTRFISLLLSLLAIYCLCGFYIKFSKEKWEKVFGIGFFVLIPSLFFVVSQISYVVLLLNISVITFYCLYRYLENKSWFNLIILSLIAGIGTLTHYSFISTFISVIIILSLYLFKEKFKNKILIYQLSILILIVVSVSGWFYLRNLLVYGNPVILNVELIDPLADHKVPDSLLIKRFFIFDPISLISQPYVNFAHTNVAKNYFWNYLYASSWFGEFTSFSPNFIIISKLLLIFGFLLILTFLVGLFAIIRKKLSWYYPAAISVLITLALFIYFNNKIILDNQANFRYLFIVLLPISLIIGRGAAEILKYKKFISRTYAVLSLTLLLMTSLWLLSAAGWRTYVY